MFRVITDRMDFRTCFISRLHKPLEILECYIWHLSDEYKDSVSNPELTHLLAIQKTRLNFQYPTNSIHE